MSKILKYNRNPQLEDYSEIVDYALQNVSDKVQQKCNEYSNMPLSELPDNVRKTLEIFDAVRNEYNLELDMLRDKYEIKFKTILAMLVSEIERS